MLLISELLAFKKWEIYLIGTLVIAWQIKVKLCFYIRFRDISRFYYFLY